MAVVMDLVAVAGGAAAAAPSPLQAPGAGGKEGDEGRRMELVRRHDAPAALLPHSWRQTTLTAEHHTSSAVEG